MGKIAGFFLLVSFGALLITRGLYVEWTELAIVMLASCAIALLTGRSLVKQRKNAVHLFAALAAFVFFWVFSLFDLAGDHWMYYLPKDGAFYDGRPLTLGEKISEFNDDLFAVCWVPALVSLTMSFAWSRLSLIKR